MVRNLANPIITDTYRDGAAKVTRGDSGSFLVKATFISDGSTREKDEIPKDEECLIVNVDRVYNLETRQYVDIKSAPQVDRQLSRKYGVVVYRQFDENSLYLRTWVEIRRDELKQHKKLTRREEVLIKLLDGAVDVGLNELPATIDLRNLFYAEEGLRQALNDEASQNGALSIQIKAVLQVLEKEFFHEKQQLAEMLGKGEIVFDKLWVLFPPRCLVTTLDAFGEPSVHRLERHHVSSPEGRRVAMEIEICCVDTDGQGYGWTTATCLKIPEFWGHAKISTLPVFPLNFHPDKDLYDKLAANGLVRLELSGAGLYEYSGIALREEDDGVERDNMTKFQCHGKVLLDPALLRRLRPSARVATKIRSHISAEDMTEDEYVAIRSTVCGYSVEDKCWCVLNASKLKPAKQDPCTWNMVDIPENRKQTIVDLVEDHFNLVGSGPVHSLNLQSLILYMTGPDAIGKSTAVKALGEKVERPVLTFSLSELGYEPSGLKQNIERVFDLAHGFGAILALDQFDALIKNGADTDFLKAALESVFYRCLDKYRGVLVVTGNSQNLIKPAFLSRLTLRYNFKGLDSRKRKNMWKDTLEEVGETEEPHVTIQDNEINSLAEDLLDRRQINNVVMRGARLAKRRRITLNAGLLQEVVSYSAEG